MTAIKQKLNYYLDRLRCRDGHGYAKILRKREYFYQQGKDCYVDFSVIVDEPYLVRLGDNVWLTDDVKILTHDGALTMLSRTTGEAIRKFGAVKFGSNVFVGMAACIMPGVSLGDNCVVATGAVVTSNVPSGCIVGGNPAVVIGTVDTYLEKWRQKQDEFAYKSSEEKEVFLINSVMEK